VIWLLIGAINEARHASDSKFTTGDIQCVELLNELDADGLMDTWGEVFQFMSEQTALGRLPQRAAAAMMAKNDDKNFQKMTDKLSFYHSNAISFKTKLRLQRVTGLLEAVTLPSGDSLRLVDSKHAPGTPVALPDVLLSDPVACQNYQVLFRALVSEIDGKANPKFNKIIVDAPRIGKNDYHQSKKPGAADDGASSAAAAKKAQEAEAKKAARKSKQQERQTAADAKSKANREATQVFFGQMKADLQSTVKSTVESTIAEVQQRTDANKDSTTAGGASGGGGSGGCGGGGGGGLCGGGGGGGLGGGGGGGLGGSHWT
jgi:hypothetical protein